MSEIQTTSKIIMYENNKLTRWSISAIYMRCTEWYICQNVQCYGWNYSFCWGTTSGFRDTERYTQIFTYETWRILVQSLNTLSYQHLQWLISPDPYGILFFRKDRKPKRRVRRLRSLCNRLPNVLIGSYISAKETTVHTFYDEERFEVEEWSHRTDRWVSRRSIRVWA